MTKVTHTTKRAFGLVTTMALAVMAGCLDSDGQTAETASLATDRDRAWTGEEFLFTPEADGALSYVYDFGDNTTLETEDPNATHAYAAGGIYEASVLILLEEGNLTASTQVFVDERFDVDMGVQMQPIAGNNSTEERVYTGAEGISSITLNLTIDDQVIFGGSTVKIQVLDADGEILFEDDVVVDETATVDATIPAVGAGDYTLRASTQTGAVSIVGALDMRYG